jgi:predicted HTH transcriptional regulator
MATVLATNDAVVAALEAGTLKEHLHANLELKSSWHKDHGCDISALGNKLSAGSSRFVIGVSDTGTCTGKDETWARGVEQTVSNHLNNFLSPVQAVKSLECRSTASGWIVLIEVIDPGTVVYWEQEAYKAVGTTSQRMSPAEVMELTIDLPPFVTPRLTKLAPLPDGPRVNSY